MTKPVDPATFAETNPAADSDLAGEPAPDEANPAPERSAVDIAVEAVRSRPRRTGWAACRQRVFIDALAETGSAPAARPERRATLLPRLREAVSGGDVV